ncbi:MAG: hypothetical protein EOL88_03010 [Bacteroidia bacterium]|nr:hypothetical protein [Bacteroidia bacterium]
MDTPKREKIITPHDLVIPSIVGLFILLLITAMLGGNYIVMSVVAMAPFCLLLLRKDIVAVLCITFYLSSFYYVGLPMNLELYQLFMVLFVILAGAERIIKKRCISFPPHLKMGLLFMGWLVIIVAIRGPAISLLGSSDVGGAVYVHSFIAFGMYVFSGYLRLTERQWRIALVTMLGMVALQFFLNLVVVLSHGIFWYPLAFIKVGHGLADTYAGYANDISTTRWSIFQPVVLIYMVPVLFWPCRSRLNYIVYGLFFMISVLIALFSGFRTSLTHVGAFVFIFFVINARKAFRAAVLLILIGALTLGIASVFAEHMPFGVQRVLSIVPGVTVGHEAGKAASSTLLWRKALWTMVIDNLPKYALCGRGFGYSLDEYRHALFGYSFGSIWRTVYCAYIGGHMHQGVLDMLLFLGPIGGLLLVSWLISELVGNIRIHYQAWNNERFKRYHLAFTVYYFVSILQFVVFEGRIQIAMIHLMFQMAVLRGLIVSDKNNTNDERLGVACPNSV